MHKFISGLVDITGKILAYAVVILCNVFWIALAIILIRRFGIFGLFLLP